MKDDERPEGCLVHMVNGYDEDCEYCQAEIETIKGQTARLTERAKLTEGRLRGAGIGVDIANVVVIRLNTLLTMILSPKQLAIYEHQFMVNYGQALDAADQQATRARLTSGIQFPGQQPGFPQMPPGMGPRR